MRYLDVSSDDIVPDPENARKTFTGIEVLAGLIEEHGLLQNLVVSEVSSGFFQIVAGERRWRAIRLLEKEGRRSKEEKIHCLVRDGSFEDLQLAQAVENEGRLAVAPWELGRRYLEFIDAGLTQEEIAARVGVSQVKVSQYARIANFTAPSVIQRMARQGPNAFTISSLIRISALVNRETGEPEEKKQNDLFDQLIRPTGRRRMRIPGATKATPRERVVRCYEALSRGSVRVPEELRPVVDAILDYMRGKTRGVVWPGEL